MRAARRLRDCKRNIEINTSCADLAKRDQKMQLGIQCDMLQKSAVVKMQLAGAREQLVQEEQILEEHSKAGPTPAELDQLQESAVKAALELLD